MKQEDIEIGADYYVHVRVCDIDRDGDFRASTINEKGEPIQRVKTLFANSEAEAFIPADELRNAQVTTEPAPKYDPCRKFHKGDKVRLVKWNGRDIVAVNWLCETNINNLNNVIFTVSKDEHLGFVGLEEMTIDREISLDVQIPVCFLELVTPVEELEPYFVMELKGAYGVYNTRFQPETEACHYFNDMHPHAKQAAEAECARLNAEHRKEIGHDDQPQR